jgi:hypothetical protein
MCQKFYVEDNKFHSKYFTEVQGFHDSKHFWKIQPTYMFRFLEDIGFKNSFVANFSFKTL